MSNNAMLAIALAVVAWLALRKKTPEGSATFGPLIHGPAGSALDDAGLHVPPPPILQTPGAPIYNSLTGFTEQEEYDSLNRYRFPTLLN